MTIDQPVQPARNVYRRVEGKDTLPPIRHCTERLHIGKHFSDRTYNDRAEAVWAKCRRFESGDKGRHTLAHDQLLEWRTAAMSRYKVYGK